MTTATPRVVERPSVGTAMSRAADEIVARLERLPFFTLPLASGVDARSRHLLRALVLTPVSSATAVVSAYLAAYAMDHLGRRPLFLFGYAVAMIGAAVGVCAVAILHQTGWPTLFAAGWLMTFILLSNPYRRRGGHTWRSA